MVAVFWQGIDWPFWLYGILAIGIGLALSSVELLTRFRSRGIREIFLTRHYFLFATLNAFFCLAVYWALPSLSKIVIKTEFADSMDQGLVRALTAGPGYLVIARTSILDISTKDGSTYGMGFDGIYNAFAQYLLDHHQRQMRRRMRDDFQDVHQNNMPRAAFQNAAKMVLAGLQDADQRSDFQARLNLADTVAADPEYCFTVYQLVRDFTTGKEEAREQISRALQTL